MFTEEVQKSADIPTSGVARGLTVLSTCPGISKNVDVSVDPEPVGRVAVARYFVLRPGNRVVGASAGFPMLDRAGRFGTIGQNLPTCAEWPIARSPPVFRQPGWWTVDLTNLAVRSSRIERRVGRVGPTVSSAGLFATFGVAPEFNPPRKER